MEKKKMQSKIVKEIHAAKVQIEEKRNEIRYITESFQVKQLVAQFRQGVFHVPKDWQRNFVWDKKPDLKCKLIESLLLGLPIPVMFFAEIETDDGKTLYQIVDGAQRTQTLEKFCDKEVGFALEDLEQLDKLNGFRYLDLPEKFRDKLDNTFMRVVILEASTSEETKQELFYRINTNAERAKPPEILRGRYQESENLFEKCFTLPKFEKICPVPKAKALRFEKSELVLRFFAYLNSYQQFGQRVDEFLEKYRKGLEEELSSASLPEKVESKYLSEFEQMVDFVEKYFDNGFRKTKNANSTPRVRYEAISVGVALALREKPDLEPDRDDIRAWLESDEFKKHTTTHSSNNKGRVSGRVEYVRDKLLAGAR